MIMKQTKISYWLKGMTILLAVMGIFFFGALTAYAFQLKAQGNVLGLGRIQLVYRSTVLSHFV